jgi:hypothetical protein
MVGIRDRQMPWGNVAFDAELAPHVVGDLDGAPALHVRDAELGKSVGGHSGHDRGLCPGYARLPQLRRLARAEHFGAGWAGRVPAGADG